MIPRIFSHIIVLILLCSLFSGCIMDADDGKDGGNTSFPRAQFSILGHEVDTFLYILQKIDVNAIIESDYDLVIIDYSRDGSDEGSFTSEEILAIRDSEKIVVSYMSIGEAEDYRYYWEDNWTVGDPEFIVEQNPEWEGNYKVKYWDEGWKNIVYSGNDSFLDRILSAGFDGVYLDIIDAYEYFEAGGRGSAAQEMIDFVGNMTNVSRKQDPDFLIIPQNGEGLLTHQRYLENISGQGKEDLYFNDDAPQSLEETSYSSSLLETVREEGKFVLVTDYPTNNDNIKEFHTRAARDGFLAFGGNRELDRIPAI